MQYGIANLLINSCLTKCLTLRVTKEPSLRYMYCRNAKKINSQEAKRMGFEELARWVMPEKDMLYLIDNYILVCLPKGGEKSTKC